MVTSADCHDWHIKSLISGMSDICNKTCHYSPNVPAQLIIYACCGESTLNQADCMILSKYLLHVYVKMEAAILNQSPRNECGEGTARKIMTGSAEGSDKICLKSKLPCCACKIG